MTSTQDEQVGQPNFTPPAPRKKRGARLKKTKAPRLAPWHIALQPLILRTTLAPVIIQIIRELKPSSVADLFNEFGIATNAKVSRSVFNSWLKDLGITFHQTTTFSLPSTPPPTQPTTPFIMSDTQRQVRAEVLDGGGVTSPDADDGDVQFANETPRDTAAISAQTALAAASLNADMPVSPSGIPTDQVVITPALSKFLQ